MPTTLTDREKILHSLLQRQPHKRQGEAAQVVEKHRRLIRKAIRRGYTLETLSKELQLPKRTLQRQLNLAGIFFRKPRTGKGVVIRPYKRRAAKG